MQIRNESTKPGRCHIFLAIVMNFQEIQLTCQLVFSRHLHCNHQTYFFPLQSAFSCFFNLNSAVFGPHLRVLLTSGFAMESVCLGRPCATDRTRLRRRDLEEEVLLLREQVRDLAESAHGRWCLITSGWLAKGIKELFFLVLFQLWLLYMSYA